MFWVTQMACAQKIRNREFVEVQDYLEGGGERKMTQISIFNLTHVFS